MARQSEKGIAKVWKAHPFTAASLQAKQQSREVEISRIIIIQPRESPVFLVISNSYLHRVTFQRRWCREKAHFAVTYSYLTTCIGNFSAVKRWSATSALTICTKLLTCITLRAYVFVQSACVTICKRLLIVVGFIVGKTVVIEGAFKRVC